MQGMDVTWLAAFTAGLLSFLSPCVLPLVPPYLAFLAGSGAAAAEQDISPGRGQALSRAGFFVLGFATVFIALGATASSLSGFLTDHLDILAPVAGIIIGVLGLHFLGLFKIGLLYREARFQVQNKPIGYVGAYIVGLAFAFGWTPCVGPVLATILFIAAGQESVLSGAALLGVYAAGIGLPFLLAAFAVDPFNRFLRKFRRFIPWVERSMGLLLVITGILFITGGMGDIAYWLIETFPGLGKIG